MLHWYYILGALVLGIGIGAFIMFHVLQTLGTLVVMSNPDGFDPDYSRYFVSMDNNNVRKLPKEGGYVKLKIKKMMPNKQSL